MGVKKEGMVKYIEVKNSIKKSTLGNEKNLKIVIEFFPPILVLISLL